jgi:hypothetical protein
MPAANEGQQRAGSSRGRNVFLDWGSLVLSMGFLAATILDGRKRGDDILAYLWGICGLWWLAIFVYRFRQR